MILMQSSEDVCTLANFIVLIVIVQQEVRSDALRRVSRRVAKGLSCSEPACYMAPSAPDRRPGRRGGRRNPPSESLGPDGRRDHDEVAGLERVEGLDFDAGCG